MSLSLGEKQRLFTSLVAKLIDYACSQGYGITLGEAWRPPETAQLYAKQGKGISKSLHIQRLAIDLNLFRDDEYLTNSEDYQFLGEFWENLTGEGYSCCWGGRFKDSEGNPRPDGNHFSIEHGGVK